MFSLCTLDPTLVATRVAPLQAASLICSWCIPCLLALQITALIRMQATAVILTPAEDTKKLYVLAWTNFSTS
jgi:hypothetical protein